VPSRYDAAYYRTHDPVGYIPSDAQSVVSQAYSSTLPMFTPGAPFLPPHLGGTGKRGGTYSTYAQSYVSQQALSQSGDTASMVGGIAPSERGSIMSTQWDRLKRRTSAGSLTASDAPDYKTMNDDASTSYAPTTYAQSQAGYTEY
jgi:regulator of nonsense transcripts 1